MPNALTDRFAPGVSAFDMDPAVRRDARLAMDMPWHPNTFAPQASWEFQWPLIRRALGVGLLTGVGALGPRGSTFRYGPGVGGARRVATARNEAASASGWPADNVIVPNQSGTYTMGSGGSWRTPYDSRVTPEQLSAFGAMPPPTSPRTDYMGPIPRYQPPQRSGPSPTNEEINRLQAIYLRLWRPEGGPNALLPFGIGAGGIGGANSLTE